MLILQGNEVPDTADALILWPAWENGYIGKFYRDCWCFCTGCNYTVLVSSKSEGYISVGATVSGETVDLKSFPDGERYDTVPYWGITCYTYLVTDPDKDFRVKLQSFGGDPDVYVNPDTPIDYTNFTLAAYNSRDHFWNEELVLDPALRQARGGSTGMYYLCVYGATMSNYKISAKNEDHSIMLKAGLSEGGYIERDQVIQLYYTDRSLMDPNIQVQFDAHVLIGAIRLAAKLCSRPAEMSQLQELCNFTLAEMLEEDPEEKVMQHVGFETLSPDPNLCSPNQFLEEDHGFRSNSEAPCIYVVGVVGLVDYTT